MVSKQTWSSAIKRAAFVCEGEGYNLPVEQYDLKSLKVRFEFNG